MHQFYATENYYLILCVFAYHTTTAEVSFSNTAESKPFSAINGSDNGAIPESLITDVEADRESFASALSYTDSPSQTNHEHRHRCEILAINLWLLFSLFYLNVRLWFLIFYVLNFLHTYSVVHKMLSKRIKLHNLLLTIIKKSFGLLWMQFFIE